MSKELTVQGNQVVKRSIVGEITLAEQTKTIALCSDEEIRVALLYVIMLLGIAPEKYPSEEVRDVMVAYIRKTFGGMKLGEIKTAFELGLEGKFKCEISLYGEVFSAKYVSLIIKSYLLYKKGVVPKPKEEIMGVMERGSHIFELLKKGAPELYESLKGGKQEPKEEKPKPRTPQDEEYYFHQRCFRQFDMLQRKFPVIEGGKEMPGYINRYGKALTMIEYTEYKIAQRKKITQAQKVQDAN